MTTGLAAIAPDTPLRLAKAAEIAFPEGGMKATGLRRERDAGRLETWFVAGKEYTSLAAIEAMIALCREVSRAKREAIVAPRLPDQHDAEVALKAALARCARLSPKFKAQR